MRSDRTKSRFSNFIRLAATLALAVSAPISAAVVLQSSDPFDASISNQAMYSALGYTSTLQNTANTGESASHPEIVVKGRLGADMFADLEKRLKRGEFTALTKEAAVIVKREPRSGLAYEIIGTERFLIGRYDEAAVIFRRAVEVESGQSGPWSKLALTLLQMNDAQGAFSALQKAVAINPSDRFAHQWLGVIYEQNGKGEQAIDHYYKGLEGTDPGYVGVAYSLAAMLNARGRYSDAVSVLESRLPFTSPRADAHHVLGVAHLGDSDYSAAIARFERATAIKPGFGPSMLGTSMALRGLSQPMKAAAVSDQVMAKFPDWPAAHTEYGQVLLQLERPDQAVEAFVRARTLGADPVLIGKLIAQAQIRLGNPAQAAAVLDDLIRSGKADPEVYAKRSELFLARGEAEAGARVLRSGIRQFPSNTYLPFRQGSYLATIRRYPDAIAVFEKLLAQLPDSASVLQALSLAQARNGDATAAAKTAERLYAKHPQDRSAGLLYATRLEADDQPQKAVEIYRATLELAPEDPLILNNLAFLLSSEQKQLDEAERLAVQAAEIASNNGHVLDTLGWVYYRQGRYEEALATFERAIGLTQKSASIYYHKGLALQGLGRNKASRKAIQQALQMNPNAVWSTQAKAMLKNP